jgi:hypothetical protein
MTTLTFRHITFMRALDVLEAALNNAPFVMMLEELGVGGIADHMPKNERTTPKLKAQLASFCRRTPGLLDTEQQPLVHSLISFAAKQIKPPATHMFSRQEPTAHEKAFQDSLAVDGWAVSSGMLVPMTAVPVQATASQLRQWFDRPEMANASRKLTQIEAALDAGHWEAANASMRTFLAEVFIGIAQIVEGNDSVRRDEADARKLLEAKDFFKPAKEPGKKSLEGEFMPKLFALLGSEGSHSGESSQHTATYRYGLTLLTAHYFMNRAMS